MKGKNRKSYCNDKLYKRKWEYFYKLTFNNIQKNISIFTQKYRFMLIIAYYYNL